MGIDAGASPPDAGFDDITGDRVGFDGLDAPTKVFDHLVREQGQVVLKDLLTQQTEVHDLGKENPRQRRARSTGEVLCWSES